MEDQPVTLFLQPFDLGDDSSPRKGHEDAKAIEIIDVLFDAIHSEEPRPPRGTMTIEELQQRRWARRQTPTYKAKERGGRVKRENKRDALRREWYCLEWELRARARHHLLRTVGSVGQDRGIVISFAMESDEVVAMCHKLWPKSRREKLSHLPAWKDCVSDRLRAFLDTKLE